VSDSTATVDALVGRALANEGVEGVFVLCGASTSGTPDLHPMRAYEKMVAMQVANGSLSPFIAPYAAMVKGDQESTT